jgi:hypothetical protein
LTGNRVKNRKDRTEKTMDGYKVTMNKTDMSKKMKRVCATVVAAVQKQ